MGLYNHELIVKAMFLVEWVQTKAFWDLSEVGRPATAPQVQRRLTPPERTSLVSTVLQTRSLCTVTPCRRQTDMKHKLGCFSGQRLAQKTLSVCGMREGTGYPETTWLPSSGPIGKLQEEIINPCSIVGRICSTGCANFCGYDAAI